MSIIDDVKEIAGLIKKYDDQDLYERIINLRDEIFTLREENLRVKEEWRVAKETQAIKIKLIRKGNSYVMEDDPQGTNNIYCLNCWDYDGKLVNLFRTDDGIEYCGICMARKK